MLRADSASVGNVTCESWPIELATVYPESLFTSSVHFVRAELPSKLDRGELRGRREGWRFACAEDGRGAVVIGMGGLPGLTSS